MNDGKYPYGFELCHKCGALPTVRQHRKGKAYQFQYVCTGQGCRYRKPFGRWFSFPHEAKMEWNKWHKEMKGQIPLEKTEAA